MTSNLDGLAEAKRRLALRDAGQAAPSIAPTIPPAPTLTTPGASPNGLPQGAETAAVRPTETRAVLDAGKRPRGRPRKDAARISATGNLTASLLNLRTAPPVNFSIALDAVILDYLGDLARRNADEVSRSRRARQPIDPKKIMAQSKAGIIKLALYEYIASNHSDALDIMTTYATLSSIEVADRG